MRTFILLAFLSILAFTAQSQTVRGVDYLGRPIFVNLPAQTVTTGTESITVNGQRVTGTLNLIGDFDPGTNTLALSRETVAGKGAQAEGNSTVQGTLIVTSGCFLNTHDGITALGSSSTPNAGVLALYDGGTHKATINAATHAADHSYTIPDAGQSAKFVLEVSPPVNSTDAGVIGNVAHDDTYWYWYTSTGWIRVAGASW